MTTILGYRNRGVSPDAGLSLLEPGQSWASLAAGHLEPIWAQLEGVTSLHEGRVQSLTSQQDRERRKLCLRKSVKAVKDCRLRLHPC